MFQKKMEKLSLQFSSTVFNRCRLTSFSSKYDKEMYPDKKENENGAQNARDGRAELRLSTHVRSLHCLCSAVSFS